MPPSCLILDNPNHHFAPGKISRNYNIAIYAADDSPKYQSPLHFSGLRFLKQPHRAQLAETQDCHI